MVVSLEEMKQYLRVDFEDDDGFITNALHSAKPVCGYRKAFRRGIFRNTDSEDCRDVCGGISL